MTDLEEANELLRDASNIRVDLHRQRKSKAISVKNYILGLKWVRAVEDELEVIRRAAGYTRSRAYELCTAYELRFYKEGETYWPEEV